VRARPLQGRSARPRGDRLGSALRGSVPQRVARFPLAQADEDEGKQWVGTRQADIADSLGVTREAAAAALRRLRDAELIETRYRRIDVLNIEGLRSIVAFVERSTCALDEGGAVLSTFSIARCQLPAS